MTGGRRWLLASLPVVIIAAVVVGVVVVRGPAWKLRPITFASPGEDVQPRAWSPDGTRYLFSRVDQYVVVRVSDGARLMTGFGAWPVWVDDDTIDSIVDIGEDRSQIRRTELGQEGGSETLPPIFETAKLVGGGYLDLAATTNIGSIWAAVVDPETGRMIAQLPDVRAIRWARTGTLVLKTVELHASHTGLSPGHLRVWTAAGGLRPIGGDLLEIWEDVSPSPSGDVIACVCARPSDASNSPGGIELVPLDGSPPTRLAILEAGTFQPDPRVHWLDDDTLVFLDGVGLHLVRRDGTALPMPKVDPSDLPEAKYSGRSDVVGGTFLLASARGSGPEGMARLTLRRDDGSLAFGASLPSWNGVWVSVDRSRTRALVMTDPQVRGEAPQRFFILSRE